MKELIIYAFYEENLTIEEIANMYSIGDEDVKQILRTYMSE